jgi:hypothetical protein
MERVAGDSVMSDSHVGAGAGASVPNARPSSTFGARFGAFSAFGASLRYGGVQTGNWSGRRQFFSLHLLRRALVSRAPLALAGAAVR